MILPHIWGQGALFSYACPTEQDAGRGFSARLCGDCPGMVFDTQNRCTLSIFAKEMTDMTVESVMADYVKATLVTDSGEYSVCFVFATPDTVLVSSDFPVDVRVRFDDEVSVRKTKERVMYTSYGETFALGSTRDGDSITYAFSYGDKAGDSCDYALEKGAEWFVVQKLAFYEKIPGIKSAGDRLKKLYYKCVSVLLACVNAPDGIIKYRYAAPGKGELDKLHLFGSAFCTIGLRHIAPDIAKETLWALLASQAADGMISAVVSPISKSSDINPPVLAWSFKKLFEVTGDKEMLSDAYGPLKKYLHYIMESRDINKNQLFEWQMSDDVNALGSESTMDNSPRFDDGIILDCVDLSAYIANEAQAMAFIAEQTDRHGEALYWNVVYERVKNAVNELLFDETDKIYYDRAVVSNMPKKIKSSASFLPLFGGICDNRHAMALLRHLNNEDSFNLKYGIPSVSADSEYFCTDMWRGPAHVAVSDFIAMGLERYDMRDKANEIRSKILVAVLEEYENSGVLYEFYDPKGRCAASGLCKKNFGNADFMFASGNVNIRDYALTAAVIVDCLCM